MSAAFIRGHTLGEPMSDFRLSAFDSVASVANVTTDFDAKISTNGAHSAFTGHSSACSNNQQKTQTLSKNNNRLRRRQIERLTQHLAAFSNDVLATPNHSYDRSTRHVRNQAGKEFLFLQILIVGLHVFL